MCGIAFKRRNSFEDYFSVAHTRGTDGVGVMVKGIKGNIAIRRAYAISLTEFIQGGNAKDELNESLCFPKDDGSDYRFGTYREMYDSILSSILKTKNKNNNRFYLLHHRKATSGSNGMDNVHPFETSKYVVFQNGSAKEFEAWGKVEFPHELDKPDTWQMAQFLDKFDDLDTIAAKLEDINFALGVVGVVEKSSGRIMLYSDGARSFYFEFEDDAKTKIEYASSLTEMGSDDYSFKGHMIFDWEGNVLENATTSLNFKKVAIATPARSPMALGSTTYTNGIASGMTDKENVSYKNRPEYHWNAIQGRYVYLSKAKSNSGMYIGMTGYYFDEEMEMWQHTSMKTSNVKKKTEEEIIRAIKSQSEEVDEIALANEIFSKKEVQLELESPNISEKSFDWMRNKLMGTTSIPWLERTCAESTINELEKCDYEFKLLDDDMDFDKTFRRKISRDIWEHLCSLSQVTNDIDEILYAKFDYIWNFY